METGITISIICFVAAYFVGKSQFGNKFIVGALLVYGSGGLLAFMLMRTEFGYGMGGDLYQVISILPTAALVLLVIGVLVHFKGGAGASAAQMQAAKPTELTTLFTPRNDTNSFSRAEQIRDEVCEKLVKKAKARGLEVVAQRSQAHSPTVWFRIDYPLPAPRPDMSLSASVAVEVERFDFHRFEHTLTVTVQVGKKSRKIFGVIALDDASIDAIQAYVLNEVGRLRLQNRVRVWPWELWRPLNKVTRIRPDWTTSILAAVGFVFLQFQPIIGLLFMVFAVIAFVVNLKKRTYVLTTGKPLTDPRSLLWMDSWQASIFGLGELAPVVYRGVMKRLADRGPQGVRVAVEKIGYWGTDSWVEREQIVLSHRRAMGFIHVVAYGDILYVAWECHLNTASWKEETLATGVDRESAEHVVANRVVASWHVPNEYDVGDTNFLGEWMHEAIKQEVKLRMAEQKIDQEIDFTVQRESRKNAVTPSGQAEKAMPGRSVFKRVA